jgi:hypothetical protein
MKNKPTHHRGTLRTAIPAVMLAMFLASIAVPTLHSFHDCGNANTCAVCTFQLSTFTLSTDPAPDSTPFDVPVLHSVITVIERVPEPFHTSVFASHAPPQFC